MDSTHYQVKEITGRETWPVRHPVLRQGRPVADCFFEGDDLTTTIHLGIYETSNLMGVATFMADDHKNFKGVQYRLRGMGVLPEYRKKGLGQQLLTEAEKRLKMGNVDVLWFNAREVALTFYKGLGFQTVGEPYEIVPIGMHYLMFKYL